MVLRVGVLTMRDRAQIVLIENKYEYIFDKLNPEITDLRRRGF